jgi:hypothetical protein
MNLPRETHCQCRCAVAWRFLLSAFLHSQLSLAVVDIKSLITLIVPQAWSLTELLSSPESNVLLAVRFVTLILQADGSPPIYLTEKLGPSIIVRSSTKGIWPSPSTSGTAGPLHLLIFV